MRPEIDDETPRSCSSMSYLRILEFARAPDTRAGEWYARDGGGAVCLEHAATPLTARSSNAASATTSWHGVLTYECGVRRKASLVFMLKYPVPCEFQDEFAAWFEDEHMPMLVEEPTWYGCRLYRSLGGSRFPFAALHDLEPQALTSEARNRSVDTPWWHRLKRHAWFDKEFVRARLTAL